MGYTLTHGILSVHLYPIRSQMSLDVVVRAYNSARRSLKQEGHREFKASLGYVGRPCLQKVSDVTPHNPTGSLQWALPPEASQHICSSENEILMMQRESQISCMGAAAWGLVRRLNSSVSQLTGLPGSSSESTKVELKQMLGR